MNKRVDGVLIIGFVLFVLLFAGCKSSDQQIKTATGPVSTDAAAEAEKNSQEQTVPVEPLFGTGIVFEDSFKDNRHKWTEREDKKVEIEVRSGEYRIEHKQKNKSWSEYIDVPIEQYEDYTIESTISRSSGVDNHGYGVLWGGKDGANFYAFTISGNGKYRFAKISNGKWTELIKWKKSEHVRTGFSKNKFTIKKIGSKYEFHLNDKLVDTYAVGTFFGNKIGFLVSLNMKIRVRDIRVTGKWTIPQIYNKIKAGAEKGSPYHQALLGNAYRYGYPPAFKEDLSKGAALIRQSAEKKHPFGLYSLGELYYDGRDFEHDKEKAEVFYKKSFPGIQSLAEAGDAFAQTHLGDIYYEGDGVEKDFKLARQWYEKAAAQGQFRSRTMIGLLYGKGEGVKKDYKKAFKYFLKEAKKGYYVAQYNVGVFYDFGWGVKKDMKAAKRWYERAVETNNFQQALNNLARFYQWGFAGTKIDLPRARKLYKKAAEKGDKKAPANYAGMLKDGQGGAKDEKEAVKWYRKGAAKGDARALRQLGFYYRYGGPVEKNAVKGIKYLFYAKEKGDELGKKWLGENDFKTGLLFPVRVTWGKDKLPKDNLKLDEVVQRTVEGYKAGMTDIGYSLFKQALQLDAGMLYKDNVWHILYENKLPMTLVSEMLLALKDKMSGTPDYWFFFAHGAILAGQPALALPAIDRMESVLARNPGDDTARMLKPMPGLMKAAAMIQMGKTEAAYKMLFEAGKPEKADSALINYINNWLNPLLKDKKKLSFVTGIEYSKFFLPYFELKPQAFHHPVSGKLIKGVTAPPKLKRKPDQRPEKRTEPQQPVPQEKPEEKGAVILQ